MLKYRSYRFKATDVAEDGEFAGYASVFDVVDYYNDVIRRGAFLESLAKWKNEDRLPPALWQHDSKQPIGPHLEMREDEKGLYVRGLLLVQKVEKAREAHALLKAKAISGMSIGFDVPADGMEYDGKTNIWNLLKINLWENSLVTFPANPMAQVETVKSALDAGRLPTPSEFEDFLRDAGGFSRRQAKHIAACGYTTLRDAGIPLRDAEAVRAIDFTPILEYLEKRA